MAKYLLVSFKTCPWVQRAAIVLREKNTPFEFRHIEPDNRPDWFLAISPHKKVPVLRIDDKVSLFESNAINEYLDETIAPRLHPDDPVQRAINRAWTDYVPTFSEYVTGIAYADDEAAAQESLDKIPVAFERLERALEKQGARAVLQRREIFAGRCRLCAVPAALFLPRPHQADRPDREISAAEGLGRHADEAAVDAFVPGGRVRGALSAERQAPEQMAVAVHRRPGGRGGVGAPSHAHGPGRAREAANPNHEAGCAQSKLSIPGPCYCVPLPE